MQSVYLGNTYDDDDDNWPEAHFSMLNAAIFSSYVFHCLAMYF